jgi:uncharacterized protein (DUF488 family)
MDIYTIGFTQTTAEHFFSRLVNARIERVLDVRLNNTSQLAGFAKAVDLPFFLRELVGATYRHEPLLAPTRELLDEAKGPTTDWAGFEERFLALMKEREIHKALTPSDFEPRTALLCSEATPERCHRRVVCEYLAAHWSDVVVTDL